MTTSIQHIDAMKQALAHLREDPSRYNFFKARKPVPGKHDSGCLLAWMGYFAGIPDETPNCNTVVRSLLDISEDTFYDEMYRVMDSMNDRFRRLSAETDDDRKAVFDAFERFIEEREAELCG